jgi:hypothetical protein
MRIADDGLSDYFASSADKGKEAPPLIQTSFQNRCSA